MRCSDCMKCYYSRYDSNREKKGEFITKIDISCCHYLYAKDNTRPVDRPWY